MEREKRPSAHSALVVPPPPPLTEEEGAILLREVFSAVAKHVRGERGSGAASEAPREIPTSLRTGAGLFVTLFSRGDLRGCIGVTPVEPRKPLIELAPEMAVKAASDDPRFPPLTGAELAGLEAEISILGPFLSVPFEDRARLPDEIRIGEHGLSISGSGRRGLLLPQVPGPRGWSGERFLQETCRKAGLPAESWRESRVEVALFRCALFHARRP